MSSCTIILPGIGLVWAYGNDLSPWPVQAFGNRADDVTLVPKLLIGAVPSKATAI